jgi:hypothetical protein
VVERDKGASVSGDEQAGQGQQSEREQRDDAYIGRFDRERWDRYDLEGDVPEQFAAEGLRAGVLRQALARGQHGFYVQHARMPPNYVVRTHRHPHSEVLAVQRGSIELGGPNPQTLEANDIAVIPANQYYGFTVGPEGVDFLTIRNGPPTTIT